MNQDFLTYFARATSPGEEDEMPAVPTVLVADDNEANRLLVEDALGDEGFRIVCCANGREALELFETERPDLALLDVRMPELDGIETCRRMRRLPGGDTVPILILTALRDVDTFDEALAAGANDYLTKPVRPTELVVRVRTALDVRRMNTELQAQYEQLRGQRDDLMRLSLQKERLITFVVHDLKNPVNSIDLQAQVVLAEPGLSAVAREGVEHVRTEAGILARMISNLLDLSKVDEGKLTPECRELDLSALVDAVTSELEPDARRHELQIRCSLDTPSVFADRELLRRVLGNLLENAIRHAPAGSVVRLHAAAAGGGVELRVSDTGAGVPTALRERIFDAFVQLDAGRAKAQGGRGLGLTFCKRAVEAHGGRIWFEPGTPGSEFCLWLPARVVPT